MNTALDSTAPFNAEAVLVAALGPRWTGYEADREVALAAVRTLERARADHAELGPGPFDWTTLTRQILHLPQPETVTTDHVLRLLDLVSRADASGRARTVAALEAFHLQHSLGVYDSGRAPDQLVARRADGQPPLPARNWLDPAITVLELRSSQMLRHDPESNERHLMRMAEGTMLFRVPWSARPFPVLAQGRQDGKILVMGHWIGPDVLAELVAHDPARPAGLEITVLVSYAGANNRWLQRTLSDATSGRVTAYEGELEIAPVRSGAHWVIRTVTSDSSVEERWLPAEPGEAPPANRTSFRAQNATAGVVRLKDVNLYPLRSGDRTRVSGVDVVDFRLAPDYFIGVDSLGDITEYINVKRGTGVGAVAASSDALGDPVPFGLEIVGTIGSHAAGHAGGMLLEFRGSRHVRLVGEEQKAFFESLTDIKALTASHPDGHLLLRICLAGSQMGDPFFRSTAQWAANAYTYRMVAASVEVATVRKHGKSYVGKIDDPAAPVHPWQVVWPEPSAEMLEQLATHFGLDAAADRDSAEDRRERVARWILALRYLYKRPDLGAFDDIRGVHELLAGPMALERMRLADAALGADGKRPITLEVLTEYLRAYGRTRKIEAMPWRSQLRKMLEEAGTRAQIHSGISLTDFLAANSPSASAPVPQFNSGAAANAALAPTPPFDAEAVPQIQPADGEADQAASGAVATPGDAEPPAPQEVATDPVGTDPAAVARQAFPEAAGGPKAVRWVRAASVLDAARLADSRFSDGALDLDRLARSVLRLKPDAPVGAEGHRELLELVAEAHDVGRADSIWALEAFYLQQRLGVLDSREEVMTSQGPVRMRNWSGRPLLELDVNTVGVVDAKGHLSTQPAPWTGRLVYPVLTMDGSGADGMLIPTSAGDPMWVDAPVVRELLRHDQWRPADGQVITDAPVGGRGPGLARTLAEGTGKRAWTPSGIIRPTTGPHSPLPILAFHTQPESPAGQWIPGDPSLDAATRPDARGTMVTVTGEVIPDTAQGSVEGSGGSRGRRQLRWARPSEDPIPMEVW
ncbi:hypothetical protein ACWDG1_50150, partial [Streptomyces sp. NPDC001177]